MTNVTITQNTTTSAGAAVQGTPTRILNVGNSIIAGNMGGDIGGTFTVTTQRGQNLMSGDPKLAPLADNGGPTKTHRPLTGSPAIDAGIDATSVDASGNSLVTDQRGGIRRSGAAVDIGAYEVVNSLVVTTLADEDDGSTDPILGTGTSLREALAWANQNPGTDTITFAAGLTGKITLTRGEMTISGSTTIAGPGISSLTIEGTDNSRIFRLIQVSGPLNDVTITDLTLAHGNGNNAGDSRYAGGAILNSKNLTLKRVVVTDNQSEDRGGGIYGIGGSLTVIDSTITSNRSWNGAGLMVFGTPLRIEGSTIS